MPRTLSAENVMDPVTKAVVESLRLDVADLRTKYTALLADVTEIRTKLVATHAKLDADVGVTDTNYAAANNPAALTATAVATANLNA